MGDVRGCWDEELKRDLWPNKSGEYEQAKSNGGKKQNRKTNLSLPTRADGSHYQQENTYPIGPSTQRDWLGKEKVGREHDNFQASATFSVLIRGTSQNREPFV